MNVDESSRPFEFWDVYYVPEIGGNNLLFMSYIINKGYLVNFNTNQYKILKKNIIVGSGDRKNNLWILNGKTIPPERHVVHVARVSINIWHNWLGHAIMRSVRKLSRLSMVMGLDVEQDDKVEDDEDHTLKCIPCLKGKTTCKVITKKSNSNCPITLYHLFSDVCGPFDVERSM